MIFGIFWSAGGLGNGTACSKRLRKGDIEVDTKQAEARWAVSASGERGGDGDGDGD